MRMISNLDLLLFIIAQTFSTFVKFKLIYKTATQLLQLASNKLIWPMFLQSQH